MLVASLRNKLPPEVQRMEDVLTAQVLGAARYLPAEVLWAPLVAAARRPDGGALPLPPVTGPVTPRFWPKWPHGDGRYTEPDVVLRWPGALAVIEVKYLSGKSEKEGDDDLVRDQLARQLVLADALAQSEGRAFAVLYLTADPTCPRRALAASLSEVARKHRPLADHLGWLGWHDVAAACSTWNPTPPHLRQLRDDLVAHLTALGFGRFTGIHARPAPFPVWRLGAT